MQHAVVLPLDLVAEAAQSEPMWLMTDEQQLLFW